MISVERARELLEDDDPISNEELEREIPRLYALARALLCLHRRKHTGTSRHRRRTRKPEVALPANVDPDAFHERAAILEFDGEMTRAEAERRAAELLRVARKVERP